MLGLVIPSSGSGGAGDLGGFILPGENVSSAQRSARIGRLLDDEDEGFNIDPGFTIDADGNLVEEPTPGPGAAPAGGMRLGSDSAASARVRQELMEGHQAGRLEVSLTPKLNRADDSSDSSPVQWTSTLTFPKSTTTSSCLTPRLFQQPHFKLLPALESSVLRRVYMKNKNRLSLQMLLCSISVEHLKHCQWMKCRSSTILTSPNGRPTTLRTWPRQRQPKGATKLLSSQRRMLLSGSSELALAV